MSLFQILRSRNFYFIFPEMRQGRCDILPKTEGSTGFSLRAATAEEKADSSGKDRPRNDNVVNLFERGQGGPPQKAGPTCSQAEACVPSLRAADQVAEELFDAGLLAGVLVVGDSAGLLAQFQAKDFFL
jgi:hypothetical protein